MVINDIEFGVILFFKDKNGETAKELDFADFHEVNIFFREHKDDPDYSGFGLRYAIAEVVDGKPDVFMWDDTIEFRELSEKEIQEKIDGYIEDTKAVNKFSDELEQYGKEFNYRNLYADYKKKQSKRSEITYACPWCMREVDDCRCKNYPGYLVQIDTLILPIIRELNSNGYVTTGCCAGHPGSAEPMQVYIAFDKDYDFDMPFPPGGKYSKLKHAIEYTPPKDMPREEYAAYQKQVLNALSEWAEMLLPLDMEDD